MAKLKFYYGFLIFFILAFCSQEAYAYIKPTQNHFRWRNDDGNLTNATWAAPQDSAITLGIHKNIRLRMELFDEQVGIDNRSDNESAELAVSTSLSGPWTLISTTSSPFRYYDSPFFADSAFVVDDLLTNTNSYRADTGLAIDGNAPPNIIWVDSSGQSSREFEYSIIPNGALVDTTYYFRNYSSSNNRQYPSLTIAGLRATSGANYTGFDISCNGASDGQVILNVAGGTPPYTYSDDNVTYQSNPGFYSVSGGTHMFYAKDALGIVFSTTITLNEPTAVTVTGAVSSNYNGAEISCNGGNDGKITLTGMGGTGSYTYSKDGANFFTAAELTGFAVGTHTLYAKDQNGCTASTTVAISEPTAVAVAIDGTTPVDCNGNTTGGIQVTATGGTVGGVYNYNWENVAAPGTSVSTDEDPTGLGAGTYTVTVTDDNGCAATGLATISEPSAIMIVENSVTNVDCNGNTTGAADLTVSGGTPSAGTYTFAWDNGGGAAEDLTGVAAGTYTLTVTDANGCMANHTVTITEPAGALTASTATATNLTCNGDGTGAIDVNVTGGTTPYTYNWENNAAPGTSIGTTEDLTGLAAGTYNLTVTDANSCTTMHTETITEPVVLTVVVNGTTNVDCNGAPTGAIMITGSGGTGALSYAWDNSVGAVEDPVGLAAGTYTVTVTDANGCTATTSATLTEPSAIVITEIGVTNVDCNGNPTGRIDIDVTGGTGGYTYNWEETSAPGTSVGAGEDLINVVAGTYQVTVTDGNGCMATHSATITQQGTLTVTNNTITNVGCNGASTGAIDINVTGGTTPYTYAWTGTISMTQDVSGLAAGVYSVVVTDANGCSTPAHSVTITEPTVLVVTENAVMNVNCHGDLTGAIDVNVSGGTSSYAYNWENAANPNVSIGTMEDIIGLAAGTYNLTVTDANGCTETLTSTITEATALSASATISKDYNGADLSCSTASDGEITGTGTGGTPPYMYSINGGGLQAMATFTGLGAGTHTVMVTDANGCTATAAPLVITAPLAISVTGSVVSNYSGADISCNGQSDGIIVLNASGGTSGYIYSLDNINYQSSNQFNNLPAGAHDIYARDANGCVAMASVTVTEPAVITVAATETNAITCNGGTDGEITVAATGGVNGYQYSLDNLTFQASPIFTGLGTGSYTVYVKDNNGCRGTASIALNEPAAFTATAAVTSNYGGAMVSGPGASDGEITVTPSGGVGTLTYDLQNGGSNTTGVFTGLGVGTHNFTITDANGCTTTASATITDLQDINLVITSQVNVACNGGNNGEINITVEGGLAPFTYAWSNGATVEDPTGLVAGTYTLTVTDANSNTETVTVTITEPTAIMATSSVLDRNGFNTSCFESTDGEITVTASGGTGILMYSIHPSVFQVSNVFTGLAAGTYTILVVDANGCTFTLTETVTEPTPVTATLNQTAIVTCKGAMDASISTTASGGTIAATSAYQYSIDGGLTFQGTGDFTGLGAGTYTVLVVDDNGCNTMETIIITEPMLLTSAADVTSDHAGADVSCTGANDGEATATAAGGTMPYTYLWNDGQTTAIATGLVAGTYTVTITDGNGCTSVSMVTLTDPTTVIASAAVTSDYNGTQISCNGAADGIITITASGGTGNLHYSIDGGITVQSNPIFDNLGAGTHNFTIIDENGCTATTSETLTEPAVLGGSIAVTSNYNGSQLSCASGSDGEITVTATGGNGGYLYSLNGGIAQPFDVITGLPAGTYTVEITDFNGCLFTTNTVTIADPMPISVSAAVTNDVSCTNGNDGEITVTATGGTGTLTYSINGSPFQTSAVFTGVLPGTYGIEVMDNNGCISTPTIVVVANPAPLFGTAMISSSYNQQAISCAGATDGEITATGTGGTGALMYSLNGGTPQSSNVFAGLGAGTYVITISDTKGCTFDVASIILHDPLPVIGTASVTSDYNGADISCNGGSDGVITVVASGGTENLRYSIDGTTFQLNPQFQGLPAGNYTVTVKDDNDCQITIPVTVTEPVALGMSTSTTPVSCEGGADGTITITATGGTGNLQYSLDNINYHNSNTLTGLSAGTYTVYVKDANGCTHSGIEIVTEPTAIIVTATATGTILCNNDATGEITVTATGGTGTYDYSLDDIIYQPSNIFSNLVAGTYTVYAQDGNGCTETTQITLTENHPIVSTIDVTSDYNGEDISCIGAADGSISTTVAGGVAPYTYLWHDGWVVPDRFFLAAGKYIVTITDANGCTAVDSVELFDPTPMMVTTTVVNNVSCFGGNDGQIDLALDGGTGPYTWTIDDTTASLALAINTGVALNLTATGLEAKTYNIVITDANGCTVTESMTLSQPTDLVATITSSTDITCNGANDGTIGLTVTGGTPDAGGIYTYFWSNQSQSEDQSGLSVGTYNVTVTDDNGCQAFAQVHINEPAVLSVSASSSTNFAGHGVSCNGATDGAIALGVTGGTTPYTFAWDNGATTQDLVGIGAGTYSVTVTDANGCIGTSSVTLTEPAALVSTVSNTNVSCNGAADATATVATVGGTGPYTVVWSDGQTNPTAINLAGGIYNVFVTDANGCATISNVTITEPTALSVSTSITQNISCNGEADGSIATNVGGGTSPYTYVWSNGMTIGSLSNVAAGTYSVTVTDANGCTESASITLTEPTVLVASVNHTNITCNGAADGTVDLTVIGGTGTYTYAWSNSAITQDLSGLSAGTYTVVVTDANGCTTTATTMITEPSALSATIASTDISCNGANDGGIITSVTGGTAPFSFAWDNSGTATGIQQGLSAGTYNVTVTDANGCTTTASATINEPTAIIATDAVTDALCFGDASGAIDLTVTGGAGSYAYNWGNGVFTEDRAGLTAGLYTVTITDGTGCQTTHSVTVGEPTPLQSSGSITNVSCNGGNDGAISVTTTGGTGSYTYAWSDPSIGNTSNASGLAAGVYTVTATDANGCTTNSSFQVTEPQLLQIVASAVQDILCNGGTGSIGTTVTGGTMPYTVVVTDANGAPVTNPNSVTVGTYTSTVTDANGCTASTMITLGEPTALAFDQTIVTDASCAGSADGNILVNVSGGTGPYLYTWGNTNNGSGNQAHSLVAGTYDLTVTDFNGCTITNTFTVNEPTPLTLTVTGADDPNDNTVAIATATAGGGTAPYTYQWSGNTGSQTGSSATNLSTGIYNVTVTDANGCTIEGSVTVQPTNVEGISKLQQLDLYPNPTTGQATIAIALSEASDINLAIYSMDGRKVKDLGNAYAANHQVQIDISNLPAGMYLVRFVLDEQIVTKKLILTKQ